MLVRPASQASQTASLSLGVVDHICERVALALTGGRVKLTVDGWSKAVLLRSGTEQKWNPQAFMRDTDICPECLRALEELAEATD